MSATSGGPPVQTGKRTLEAPDDHPSIRSRAPRVTRQKLRRRVHGTHRDSRTTLRSVDHPRPVVRSPSATAVPTARRPLAATAETDGRSRSDLRDEVGGARLLASDIRLAFVLMNEARYRTFELIGVPRDQANLATFVAIVMAADRLEAAQRALENGPRPSHADAILGVATCNEALKAIGGAPMRQHPLLGPLVAFAVLSASARPVLKRSVHGIRTASHDARVSFLHRYGHPAS